MSVATKKVVVGLVLGRKTKMVDVSVTRTASEKGKVSFQRNFYSHNYYGNFNPSFLFPIKPI